ncbi:uncharacterized protein LOC128674837 isoform X2 [Plodia interpunctella]|uniref:uncharacterized protein LOC128674837 isoform X2 n=1 Tax=Plodia interpunctella TaxID=58824 RepID=UPI0023676516|nr:uncharacterized protein LOC128674837 isoform X2 [Plodia interpunctella]
MGVFKMPTVQEFLDKKVCYDPKKTPVWEYLEEEMLANIDKKPYNKKVGAWLKYLRDLKYYQYCEERKVLQRLEIEVGPAWYIELSSYQRSVLACLSSNIHQDILEGTPNRVRQSLRNLGVTLKIPKKMLIRAMKESENDIGIFIWCLYTAYYKSPPSEPKKTYSMNAMILMSSLVFIDLEECITSLENLVKLKKPSPPTSPKPQKKPVVPTCRYGVYLQKPKNVQLYSNHSSGDEKKPETPKLDYKFRLRSQASYTALRMDHSFLKIRKERIKRDKGETRVCNFKFWEPPTGLRSADPAMAAYAGKMKMLKIKAKQKYKAPYKNIQYQVGGVSFSGGKPNYVLSSVGMLTTGYIPINAGIVCIGNENVTTLHGYWMFPKTVISKCDDKCDCLRKWEQPVMEYLQKSKCRCGHLYDYYHEGKPDEIYIKPPTEHGPFTIDKSKIYQMDPMEDFIKDTVRDAVKSADDSAFLADLSNTALIIPHLPDACLLNNLQEWVRKRVFGPLTQKEHNQMKLQSLRRWLDLKHMDFRARAGMMPFTLTELDHMDWSYRNQVQVLFLNLLEDFTVRNQLKQVEQARLWWPTMKYDAYPNKSFRDVFFTYMPSRLKDTFMVNPYSSENTPKWGAKTCPL